MNSAPLVAASADSRPLTAAEKECFAELELPEGHWRILSALPLIQAAWLGGKLKPRQQEKLYAGLLLLTAPARDSDPPVPEETRTQLAWFLKDLVMKPEPDERTRRRLETGRALWCWHLATDYQWEQREDCFAQVRHEGCCLLSRKVWPHLDAVVEALRPTIDAYLPCREFCRQPSPETLPARATTLAGLSQGLLIVPLLELLGKHHAADAAVARSLEACLLQEQNRSESVLADLLLADWQRWLRGFAARRDAGKEEVQARLEESTVELVRQLAALAYEDRERLFDRLAEVAGQVRGAPLLFFSTYAFPQIVVLNFFADLRARVDEARKAARAQPEATSQESNGAVAPVSPEPQETPALSEGPRIITAEPFETIGYAQALAEARSMSVAEVKGLLDADRPLLFEEWCLVRPGVAIVQRASAVPANLWYVGDLHCDLLALANAWHYIRRHSERSGQPPHVVFLGDFVDRGVHDHETLLYLFGLIRNYPNQIGVLIGNHDEHYHWDDSSRTFHHRVIPAEYAESLNALVQREDEESRERVELGKLSAAFFQKRPRALILPDGLLAAHGGFPHTDLLDTLHGPADLSRPECLQDFVWLRISENAPRKVPNRANRGCQFGFEDFARFCQWTNARLPVPVQRMLRGHDHVPERYEWYPRYRAHPILTLNTMCRHLDDEMGTADLPLACVARHVSGGLPEVHRLSIDPQVVRGVYSPE